MKKKAVFALVFVAGIVLLALAPPLARNREVESLASASLDSVGGSFVTLPGGRTHYELAGASRAPVVVLIHGATVPYYIWDPTFHALAAAGFRVLRYDLYGRGWSDRPDGDYDRDLYETQLLELLEMLRIPQPVDVVGLSMGGSIATGFAARHPERVRRLALISPVSQQGDIGPLALPLIGDYLMATSVAPSLPGRQMTDFAHPERFPDWADRYREQMRFHGFRRAILSSYRHFSTDDPWPYYEAVGEQGRPVLLIWGRLDDTVPFSRSEVVREALNAEFAPIDDAGHLAHYERPEAVEPVLIEFLSRGAPKGEGVLASLAGAARWRRPRVISRRRAASRAWRTAAR